MKKTTAHGRKLARMSEWEKQRHRFAHPVAKSCTSDFIQKEISSLRAAASFHAFFGDNAPAVVEQAGRLAYVVAYAAGLERIGHTPDARILEGAASALGDLSEHPGDLERVRASICNGLDAVDRLLPQLAPLAMAAGALHLDEILQVRGLMVSDVRRALQGGLAA